MKIIKHVYNYFQLGISIYRNTIDRIGNVSSPKIFPSISLFTRHWKNAPSKIQTREREREKTIPPTGHVSPVSRRDIVRTRYARMRATIILSTLKISIINPAFLSSLPLSPSLWSSQQNSQGITFRTRHASLSLPATSGAETGYNYKRSPKRV